MSKFDSMIVFLLIVSDAVLIISVLTFWKVFKTRSSLLLFLSLIIFTITVVFSSFIVGILINFRDGIYVREFTIISDFLDSIAKILFIFIVFLNAYCFFMLANNRNHEKISRRTGVSENGNGG